MPNKAYMALSPQAPSDTLQRTPLASLGAAERRRYVAR